MLIVSIVHRRDIGVSVDLDSQEMDKCAGVCYIINAKEFNTHHQLWPYLITERSAVGITSLPRHDTRRWNANMLAGLYRPLVHAMIIRNLRMSKDNRL